MAEPTICLLFTYGVSLKQWVEDGHFDREVLLYQKLAHAGVRVAFYTYGDHSDLEYADLIPGIEIYPAYAQRKRPTGRISRLISSLLLPFKDRHWFSKFDILKSNQMYGAWVALIASKLTKRKFLLRCGYELLEGMEKDKEPLWKRAVYKVISRSCYRKSSHIVLTSQHIAGYVTSKFGISRDKISVHYNFVDTERFSSRPGEAEVDLPDRVLFVGRLHGQKNLHWLIDAVAELGIGLDIVGAGPLEQELREQASRLEADIQFLGRLPNDKLSELMTRYPLLALPSTWEGNPKVLLEAMSCERGVVGTDVVGTREMIQHGKNGLLCALSSKEIKGAVHRLMSDPPYRKSLGKNARTFIVENCSLNKTVEKEITLYRKIKAKGS